MAKTQKTCLIFVLIVFSVLFLAALPAVRSLASGTAGPSKAPAATPSPAPSSGHLTKAERARLWLELKHVPKTGDSVAEKPDEKPEKPETADSAGGSGPLAYLTFDDGPSTNTLKILDILAEHGVNATFFVTGNNLSGDPDIYRRVIQQGHALGNHTFSHNYHLVYKSVTHFLEDVLKLEDFLFQATGMRPKIFRFPGGSSNNIADRVAGYPIIHELIEVLRQNGYDYFDWNVVCGDGTETPPVEQIIETVKTKVTALHGQDLVILMHDSQPKYTTVEALPEIIKLLKDRGYEFAVLAPGTVASKHRIK